MTNQEQIEQAENAIEIQQATINSYQVSIKHAEKRIQEWQAKLADLKKQPEPKEGEWWIIEDDTDNDKWLIKYKSMKNDEYVNYYEMYTNKNCFTDCFCLFNYNRLTQRKATTEEITYFMGLHADRLGLVKVAIIYCANSIEYKWKIERFDKFEFNNGEFRQWGLHIDIDNGEKYDNWYLPVRLINGQWATVVKDEPKPKKMVKKSVKLQRIIDKQAEQIKSLKSELTQSAIEITSLMSSIQKISDEVNIHI